MIPFVLGWLAVTTACDGSPEQIAGYRVHLWRQTVSGLDAEGYPLYVIEDLGTRETAETSWAGWFDIPPGGMVAARVNAVDLAGNESGCP